MLRIGAHFSIKGHVKNALNEAQSASAGAMALFVANQRTWRQTPLADSVAAEFRTRREELGIDPKYIIPHGSYLMNLGSWDDTMLAKSRDRFRYELQRCEQLGLTLFNFHPGATLKKISVEECIERISESINIAHSETKSIVTVLENVAGQGSSVGRTFEELAQIIENVKDKSRVGVCFDTCHGFAAGYDLRTFDKCNETFEKFDKIIGLKYLKAIHLNDSKGEFDSRIDRHQNIGHGEIGVECFRFLANDKRFLDLPIVLETSKLRANIENEYDSYAEEIRWFQSLVGSNESDVIELTKKDPEIAKPKKKKIVKKSSSTTASKRLKNTDNNNDEIEDEKKTPLRKSKRSKTM